MELVLTEPICPHVRDAASAGLLILNVILLPKWHLPRRISSNNERPISPISDRQYRLFFQDKNTAAFLPFFSSLSSLPSPSARQLPFFLSFFPSPSSKLFAPRSSTTTAWKGEEGRKEGEKGRVQFNNFKVRLCIASSLCCYLLFLLLLLLP